MFNYKLIISLSKIKPNIMGREKIEESKKKKRLDVFIEDEKIQLIGKKECAKLAKKALDSEYERLKSNK